MTFKDRCQLYGVRLAAKQMPRNFTLADALQVLRFARIGRVELVTLSNGNWIWCPR